MTCAKIGSHARSGFLENKNLLNLDHQNLFSADTSTIHQALSSYPMSHVSNEICSVLTCSLKHKPLKNCLSMTNE